MIKKALFVIILIQTILQPAFIFAQADAPNVILILADDQGWGATSVQMSAEEEASASDFFQTSHLETLAERGVIFSKGYAPHPNCSPSRASILTGKSPAQLHLTDIIERNTGPLYEGNYLNPPKHLDAIPDKEFTIAEWIKKHRPEYSTAHFGKWHIANGGPAMNGFDAGDGPTTNNEGQNNPPDDPKQIYSMTKRGLGWMEQQVEAGKPFYLQLSYYAVHLAMAASPGSMKEVSTWTEGQRHTHKKFAGMTKDLDNGLGMLFKKIKELGIEDNTYIIYTSDNGTYPTTNPSNVNGPVHGWKASLWEGGIRVPFMIAGPDIKAGRSDLQVVGYDIFPTICDWLRIDELPAGLEGGSLAPLLANQNSRIGRAQDFLVFHFPHYQLQKGSHPVTSIYKGEYKLLKFYETGELRLYNLENDLPEEKDVSAVHPEIVEELDSLLTAYLKQINAQVPERNQSFDPQKYPGKNYQEIKLRLMNESYFLLDE